MKYWKIILSVILFFLIFIGNLLYAKINQYFITDFEKDVRIVIAVENQALGEAIIDLWNKTYPQHLGVVDYKIVSDYLDTSTDIIYGRVEEMWLVQENLLSFTDTYIPYDSIEQYFLEKETGIYFHPLYYDGLVFVYNESILKELGVSTLDADGDGLPEAFDTFEEIFELCTRWEKEKPVYKEKALEYVFPFAFNDFFSFYPFLTAGDWSLQTQDNLGFNQYEFYLSLEFIHELGNYNWSFNKNIGQWQYIDVLVEETAPFSLAADWMIHEYYEEINHSEIRYARFPTYQGIQLRPLVYIYGYSISADSLYPKAAQALLQLLQGKEGYQLFVDYGEHVSIIPKELSSSIIIEKQSIVEWMKAYRYSQVIPYEKVEEESIFSQFQPIVFMETVEKLFRHEINVNQAREWFENWMSINTLEE